MGTLTRAASLPALEHEGWHRELAVLLAAIFFTFATATLLAPVLPTVAERSGGKAMAGLATALFYLPAVALQLRTPRLLYALPPRRVVLCGLALMGVPCVAYVVAEKNLVALLAATALRGAGFGIAVVSIGTLIAQVAPPHRQAHAMAYWGLAAGISPTFAPAVGVYLLHEEGARVVFLLATSLGLVGSVVPLFLSRRPPQPPGPLAQLRRALVDRGFAWPVMWFGLASMTRGAAISFVPLWLSGAGLASASTFLLLFGALGYVSRWVVSRFADHLAPRTWVVPALGLGLVGLVVLATGRSALSVIVAGSLYGLSQGALLSASLLEMLARTERSSFALPTALWNVSFDAGFGIGGMLFGVIAFAVGLGAALWVLPAMLLFSLVIVLAEPPPAPLR